MGSILLVDDLSIRMYDHLGAELSEKLKSLVHFFNSLPGYAPNIKYDFESLKEYDIIAIHRSWLVENRLLNDVVKEMKTLNKYLIIFSGGISQNILYDNGLRLTINVKDFYSENTINFIQKYLNNLDQRYLFYKLLYGENWKLPLLLKARLLLWRYKGKVQDLNGITQYSEANRNHRSEARVLSNVLANLNMASVNQEISIICKLF